MSKFLIDDRPLIVLPALAKELGSVERALVLQQIYWMAQQPKSGIDHEGYHWVWGTYEEWCELYFSMWKTDALRRHINWLETNGYLVSAKLRSAEWNHTKYYRINHSRLENDGTDEIAESGSDDVHTSGSDDVHTSGSDDVHTSGSDDVHTSYNESDTSSETSTLEVPSTQKLLQI